MAICAYFITGQLLDADVGSVTMWAVPESAGQKSMDENFLQVTNNRDALELETSFRPRLTLCDFVSDMLDFPAP